MRKLAIALCVFVGFGAAANAAESPSLVDQLTKTIKGCAERKDTLACERSLFTFADATKDDKLSKAEMTRALRWLAAAGQQFAKQEMGDQQLPADVGKHLSALQLYAMLLGPYLADGIIYNFDYDGDGLVAKTEIYLDNKEGELDKALMAMVESGQSAAKSAMSMALEGGLAGLGGKPLGMPKSSAGRTAAPAAASARPKVAASGVGLKISGVTPTRSGANSLTVTGVITNVSQAMIQVPTVHVALLGPSGNELQGADATFDGMTIRPGAMTGFDVEIQNPSPLARNVEVKFK